MNQVNVSEEGKTLKKKPIKGNMTTKDPEMFERVKWFNDSNESYQERKKAWGGINKGFIQKPQDAIALQMANIQIKGFNKVIKTAGAFGKGGIRKAGGQRGS